MAKFFNRAFTNTTDDYIWIMNILTIEAGGVQLYRGGDYLVFTIPSYSSKVIRFYKQYNSYGIAAHFADSWTSGATITGNVTAIKAAGYSAATTGTYLIIDVNYILFGWTGGDGAAALFIIGKTSLNNTVHIGYSNNASAGPSGFMGDNYPYKSIGLRTLSGTYWGADSKLFREPIIVLDQTGNVNISDGILETITGIYSITYSLNGYSKYLITSSGWFSPNGLLTNTNMYLSSSLFIPL